MQTLRLAFLALVLLALAPLTASAQVIAGTSFYFDHAAEDQAQVEKYQLCVDTVTDANCRDVGVTRVGTSEALTFTLPSWVPKGKHALSVRAVWKAPLVGTSASTNALTQNVVGGPERLRTTEAP